MKASVIGRAGRIGEALDLAISPGGLVVDDHDASLIGSRADGDVAI